MGIEKEGITIGFLDTRRKLLCSSTPPEPQPYEAVGEIEVWK